jgi:hypothetical protein
MVPKSRPADDTGPLTTERLPTIDAEYLAATIRIIRNAHSANRPSFTWFAPTRMDFPTTLPRASKGATGQDLYADGMMEHDGHVGQLLDLLDELAIAHTTPSCSGLPTMAPPVPTGRTGALADVWPWKTRSSGSQTNRRTMCASAEIASEPCRFTCRSPSDWLYWPWPIRIAGSARSSFPKSRVQAPGIRRGGLPSNLKH